MPELPEVETTRRWLNEATGGQTIVRCRVNQTQLRLPISPEMKRAVKNAQIIDWQRRGKYLIGRLSSGCLLIHLGMSGRLTDSRSSAGGKHDHVIWSLDNGVRLVFHDPRRFGCVLYAADDNFSLLRNLGVEPLERALTGRYLMQACAHRRQAIKNCLMDQRIVAGLGNIYVNEALFLARLHPLLPACAISDQQYLTLSRVIKQTLRRAVKVGGTSLRDFSYGEKWMGNFSQSLAVYERAGQPCVKCRKIIHRTVIANRSSYYCPVCQALPKL